MLLGDHGVLITVVFNKGKTGSHNMFQEHRKAVRAVASRGGEGDKAGHKGRNQIMKGFIYHAKESGLYLVG